MIIIWKGERKSEEFRNFCKKYFKKEKNLVYC
jgi:hypothetical protein